VFLVFREKRKGRQAPSQHHGRLRKKGKGEGEGTLIFSPVIGDGGENTQKTSTHAKQGGRERKKKESPNFQDL